MNENIDLTKILKDFPEGTKLYSPIFGEVDFKEICSDYEYGIITTSGNYSATFTKEGFYYADADGECTLFPSKEQRDWSKFTATWLKKEKFDPKTLKAFDRVLCKNDLDMWRCDLFSSYVGTYACPNVCIGGSYTYCIPYNNETKHLVGTTDEASDFYRYWEE